MTASLSESPLMATENLLTYYNFQDETQTQDELLDRWLRSYPERWVRLALIEALYQGRYKSVSVEFLLQLWQRRGQPIYHFNSEFAALVCHNVPQTFLSLKQPAQQTAVGSSIEMPIISGSPKKQRSGSVPTVPTGQAPAPIPAPTPAEAGIASPAVERPATDMDGLEAAPSSSVSAPSSTEPLSSDNTPVKELPLDNAEERVHLALDTNADDDWLTSELEMTAVENVQALVKQVAQKTDDTTSPIHHFMPVVQESTGLYSRLAAIANTRTRGTD